MEKRTASRKKKGKQGRCNETENETGGKKGKEALPGRPHKGCVGLCGGQDGTGWGSRAALGHTEGLWEGQALESDVTRPHEPSGGVDGRVHANEGFDTREILMGFLDAEIQHSA